MGASFLSLTLKGSPIYLALLAIRIVRFFGKLMDVGDRSAGVKKWIFPFFLQVKTKSLGDEIVELVGKSRKILDFGCGNMLITKYVQDKLPGSNVVGVDVLDLNLTEMRPLVYNGIKLPFKDREFDLLYTIFVLHHCDKEVEILREAMRVARKVIIIEEIYINVFEKYVTFVHDWIMNHLESFDIHVPLHFHADEEWKKIFRNLKWKVVFEKRVFQMPWWFTRQKLYMLERV